MKISIIGFFSVLLIFLHGGCASKKTDITKTYLIEAETAIGHAKLAGAQSVASSTLAKAEQYYKQASDDYYKEAGGRLVASIRESVALKAKSADNALRAKKEAELAMSEINKHLATSEVKKQYDHLKNQEESLQKELQNQNLQIKSQNESLKEEIEKLESTNQMLQKELESKDIAKPKALYLEAFYLFHGRKYEASRKKLQSLLEMFPDSDLSENAQYWIGENYFMQKKYKEACMAFETVLAKYKKGNKSADSLFKLGRCYYRIRNYEKSKQRWQSVIKLYPGSSAAARAREFLNKFHK